MRTNENYPLYNSAILNYQASRLDKTPERLALDANISLNSVHAGLAGHLKTLTRLRRLSDALGVNWQYITTIDLPESEFHRALVKKRVR